ncbi:hypothetical protein [Aestuariispira ectoiniformans]|uniref:hypothetical protein n=1 Tax=Aestuariispira ectoiniformans TaxID=2775080 RepID=UPI00223A8889|nr:hypothetical protein [Aestuariispira ectoiniformans]
MQTASPDAGFAPWSLMVPEPPKAAATKANDSNETTRTARNDKDAPKENPDFFGKDGLTFGDFLDIVNPLQHLPVIGTIYRELTGDDISPGARLAGDTLYGGPLGMASAVVNNAMEEHSGKDMGETVLAYFTGDETDDGAGDTQVAEAPAGKGTEDKTAGPVADTAAQPVVQQAAAADPQAPVLPLAASTPRIGKPLFGPHNPLVNPLPEAPEAKASAEEPVQTAQVALGTPTVSSGKPKHLSADVARQLEHMAALSQERLAIQAQTNRAILKQGNKREKAEAATAAPTPTPANDIAAAQQPPKAKSVPPAKASAASRAYETAAMPAPVTPDNLPEAMLSALKKYEIMLKKDPKQG